MPKRKRKTTDLQAANAYAVRDRFRDHWPINRHVVYLPRVARMEHDRAHRPVRLTLGPQSPDDTPEAR